MINARLVPWSENQGMATTGRTRIIRRTRTSEIVLITPLLASRLFDNDRGSQRTSTMGNRGEEVERILSEISSFHWLQETED
jgi:hypothetical protein